MPAFDAAVVGLGAMGSAVALHLARRGLRVLGIDRYAPPHVRGSSHGRSRLIREAYYEDPLYVPLVRRSLELWRDLERETNGVPLVVRTGSLMIGAPDSGLVSGTLDSARRHAVEHELLSAEELRWRFPAFSPHGEMVAVYEPGSSLLDPERIVALQLELAGRAGAQLLYGETVLGWDPILGGVALRTDRGSHLASQVVLSAGGWAPRLLAPLAVPLEVERQVQSWWAPAGAPDLVAAGRMPVSMWQLASGRIFYTMPDRGDGVKAGWHHNGQAVDPDAVDRVMSTVEADEIAELLRRFVPAACGERRGYEVCLYTNTPDRHFLVDRHPGDARVLIVSACSGHGFKFASVIGEIVTDLLTTGRCAFDLGAFRATRWGTPAQVSP